MSRKTKIVQKTWGWEEWRVNDEKYCLKFLGVYKGAFSSVHMHPVKQETFYVFFGTLHLFVADDHSTGEDGFFVLNEEDSHCIFPGEWHSFFASDEIVGIHEVSTHHDDDDVERLSKSAFGTEEEWKAMIEKTRSK